MSEMKAMAALVRDYFSRALEKHVNPRLKALEERAPVPGPKGDAGKDADLELVRSEVEKVVAALPKAKDGEPGKDAPAVDVDALVERVRALMPVPKDGEPGKDADEEAIAHRVAEHLKMHFPVPKDGASVTLEDVLPAIEGMFSKWAIEVERRASDRFDAAIKAMPQPKDGKDAFELEDLHFEHDGNGRVTLSFKRGELSREFQIRLPRFKDRGVYRDGESYEEGDGVSYAGSFWLAQQDSPPLRPDAPESGWRLAVKRGRDGKNAGPAAAAPEVVRYK